MFLFSNNEQDNTRRCRSFVMWCCVVKWVVLTFRRTVAHYNPSKCQELLVQQHSVTFQKTWIPTTLLLEPQISQGKRWTWNIQVNSYIKHSWCQKTRSCITFMAPSLSRVISCSASAAFWLNSMASSSATLDFSASRSAVSSDRRYTETHTHYIIEWNDTLQRILIKCT